MKSCDTGKKGDKRKIIDAVKGRGRKKGNQSVRCKKKGDKRKPKGAITVKREML